MAVFVVPMGRPRIEYGQFAWLTWIAASLCSSSIGLKIEEICVCVRARVCIHQAGVAGGRMQHGSSLHGTAVTAGALVRRFLARASTQKQRPTLLRRPKNVDWLYRSASSAKGGTAASVGPAMPAEDLRHLSNRKAVPYSEQIYD